MIENHGAAALETAVIAAALYLAWLGILKVLRPRYPDRTGNGIAAGPVKLYDNRFLSIRLDELESNLQKLGGIDPDKLDQNIGATQAGVQTSDAIEITPPPDDKKSDASAQGGAPSADPKFSQSAQARLAEQINLRYELVGLRMILERSLTDRLWPSKGPTKEARLQAVLGLQVSLDPPASCKGCVAVVELTLTTGSGEPVSLVALLPQERTNNAIFTNSRSAAIKGAAGVPSQPFGFSWKHSRESGGMVAEPETVGFQRPPERTHNNRNALTVGWQFRPLPGSPAVTPGLRQVFAVVALPSTDPRNDDPTVPRDKPKPVEVAIRTYWRRYDSKTGATSPRWGWIPWRLASEERTEPKQTVELAFTEDTLEELSPGIDRIITRQLGPDTVVVMIDGKNFFPGTTVAIGSKLHRDTATGLLIKSDQHMQITTAPEELVYGEGVINGRYGPTVQLLIPPEGGIVPAHGIPKIPEAVSVAGWIASQSSGAGFQWLSVYISGTAGDIFRVSHLAHLPEPIVMVGDHVVSQPYYFWEEAAPTDKTVQCVVLQAIVPVEWDPVTTPMRLTFPFCGKPYQLIFGMNDTTPNYRFSVVRWDQEHTVSLLILIGDPQFTEGEIGSWSVELGDQEYPLEKMPADTGLRIGLFRLSDMQIRLTVPIEKMRLFQTIVVHYKWTTGKFAYPLQIPPAMSGSKA